MLFSSGVAACQHILGHTAVRGVPEVIAEDLHPARFHAVHVHRCRGDAHGFIRSQEHEVIPPCSSSVVHFVFASANDSCSQDAKEIRAAKQGTLLQEANGRVFHSIHEIFSRMKMYIRNVCVLIVETQDYVDVIYILSKEKLLIG